MPVTATPREGTFIRRWGGMFGYRFVVLIAVALVMAVLAVAYAVQSSRRQVRAETEAAHLTQAIAIGPADQVSRTVDAVGFVLADLMARAQRGEAQALSPDMSNLVQDMPQLRGILILDGHGRVVEAMPAALRERDFGGSAWFKELLAIREAGAIGVLRVVGPQPGRLLDEPTGEGAWRRWTIPLALARPAAGGIQGEFAVALLNPEYLTAIAATPGVPLGWTSASTASTALSLLTTTGGTKQLVAGCQRTGYSATSYPAARPAHSPARTHFSAKSPQALP